jgi:hypothetical protein
MNAVTFFKPVISLLFSVLIGGGHGAGTAEVKYVPVSATQGVFNVVYNNTAGSRFVLKIEDQDGNQLYQNIFTDKVFSRNFQLAEPDNYSKLVFIIRNLGDQSVQTFEVETNTRVIEDVQVEEVKQ